jgi:uncharacterized membrane protein YwzB
MACFYRVVCQLVLSVRDGANLVLPLPFPLSISFGPLRHAAFVISVMAVTAFLTAWFNLQSTKMEAFMRFDIKQQIERLTLALGVAAVGITLLATVFAAAH